MLLRCVSTLSLVIKPHDLGLGGFPYLFNNILYCKSIQFGVPSDRWLQPYKVLSYDRPEEPAASAAEGNQEQVAGATGIDSKAQGGNGSRRDANLETSSLLTAGFGRYYDSVPEGPVRGNEKVSCPQNQ